MHWLPDDADASALQPVARESIGVRGGRVSDRGRCDRVGGVVAGDDIEDDGRVSNRSRNWPQRIRARSCRAHAVTAHQRQRGSQADDVVDGSRSANRSARVFADADGREIGGNTGAGSA